MLILDATTKSLEIVLSGAVTTNQLPVVASYVDVTTSTFTPGSSDTASNNTSAVTVVAAPSASTQRQVKLLTVQNKDTASATVTLSLNDNGTLRAIVKVLLAVNDSLIYTDGEGFRCIDGNGQLKQGTLTTGAAGGDLTGTYPNPTVPQASGAFALTGIISPTSLSTDQDDYNPTGLSGAVNLRLASSADVNITGIQGGATGRLLTVRNINASGGKTITLKNENIGSSAANRIVSSNDVALLPGDACTLLYDNTSTRWAVIGKSPGSASTGNVTTTSAYASAPGTPASGDVWYPNNSFYVLRYSGSAEVPWGPLFPFTDPSTPSWVWINQGSASVVTTNGGIALIADASNTHRIRKIAAPSRPYTITMAFLFNAICGGSFPNAGFCWRQSSDGKLVFVYVVAVSNTQVPTVNVAKWTDPATFSANYVTPTPVGATSPVYWLQMTEDNTNRTTSYSVDGQNFTQIHQVGRTDFMTADEIGFAASASGSGFQVVMTLLSWKQT